MLTHDKTCVTTITISCLQVLGKISLQKKDLHKYHGKEHWFPLLPVEANSEVQVRPSYRYSTFNSFHSEYLQNGTLTNSKDPDEMLHNTAFHWCLHCLLRPNITGYPTMPNFYIPTFEI